MDNTNITDEQNSSTKKEICSTKLRNKERHRTQTIPTNADINDPEYLDYEDTDDHHSSVKLDENHQVEQITNPVKNLTDNTKSSDQVQDEQGEITKNLEESNNKTNSTSITNNLATASDEGELDEADLEDGEIHDPSASKTKISSNDEQLTEQKIGRNNSAVPVSPHGKVQCRFYLQGRCNWGPNCKYIHPNNDTTKNVDSLGASIDALSSTNNDISPPTSAAIPISQTRTNSWISPQPTSATSQFFPNQLLRGQAPPPGIPLVPPTGTESAWERGLRSAKTLRAESMRRKEQDKDFNDKKFNLTIRDAVDERETDDNLLNVDRSSSMDFDLAGLSGSNYGDQRNYVDRYHSYSYSSNSSMISHFNNHHRMNKNARHNNSLNTTDHFDRRMRHSDDYNDSRNDNRNRKEKLSTKDNKSTTKRNDPSLYKRNSTQQYSSGLHHNNDDESHHNIYNTRRGDDWHDPWDRSRNHGGNNRRSLTDGRGPSFSSTSGSSSSSSRSSRSRSQTTSSSSRSRSRSRSRPKRRSPSVTRAPKQSATTKSSETVKNGNEKKSNGNKKLTSPTTTNKFLPGRQISSHTLKKAEKSSNSSNSTGYNHSKEHYGKDSDVNSKKQMKKENLSRSDSTSSSSSSDSDTNRIRHDSSSSSSDSSSSENETRTSTKLRTSEGKTCHSTKTINRQLSSSSGVGNKTSNTKSINNLSNRESLKNKEISSKVQKKRRDTSSSTGSTTTTKKTKLNVESHKSNSDGNNPENSDFSRKKKKQKLLKKLEAVEKLINQQSTKTLI